MKQYVEEDEHATSTIGNIYFDNDRFQMIRESLEKPYFKEKLRMRTYEQAPTDDSTVFLEIKKKVRKIVYKRRIDATLKAGEAYLMEGDDSLIEDSQIKREMDWLKTRYGTVKPKMYIYYDRFSMKGKEDESVRITIDHNILYRDYDLSLSSGVYGDYLLPEDHVIMEIKIPGAYPLWLVEILNKYHVYPTSFSKYGTAYKKVTKSKGVLQYV